MKTYNIIPIGTEVIVNSNFKGIIVSVSIRMNSVNYEVQKTTEDGVYAFGAADWEIASNHKMDLAVASLIKAD